MKKICLRKQKFLLFLYFFFLFSFISSDFTWQQAFCAKKGTLFSAIDNKKTSLLDFKKIITLSTAREKKQSITPLLYAIQKERPDFAAALVSRSDTTVQFKGDNTLILAIKKGYFKLAKQLINPNTIRQENWKGQTAVVYTFLNVSLMASMKASSLFEDLLAASDLSKKMSGGNTLLMMALNQNSFNRKKLRLLMEASSRRSLNQKNNAGRRL